MLLTEFDQKSYDNGLIKVGVEKERYEKMCEMITMNFPVESIAKLYKVPVDYVLKLKNDLENNATNYSDFQSQRVLLISGILFILKENKIDRMIFLLIRRCIRCKW